MPGDNPALRPRACRLSGIASEPASGRMSTAGRRAGVAQHGVSARTRVGAAVTALGAVQRSEPKTRETTLAGSAETIAVVVVTYNSARFLPDLIKSLDVGLDGLNWHLTIADNASSDDSIEVLAGCAPDARLVETGRNAGYAAGINAAVA